MAFFMHIQCRIDFEHLRALIALIAFLFDVNTADVVEYYAFATEQFVAHFTTEILDFLVEMFGVIAEAGAIGKLFVTQRTLMINRFRFLRRMIFFAAAVADRGPILFRWSALLRDGRFWWTGDGWRWCNYSWKHKISGWNDCSWPAPRSPQQCVMGHVRYEIETGDVFIAHLTMKY